MEGNGNILDCYDSDVMFSGLYRFQDSTFIHLEEKNQRSFTIPSQDVSFSSSVASSFNQYPGFQKESLSRTWNTEQAEVGEDENCNCTDTCHPWCKSPSSDNSKMKVRRKVREPRFCFQTRSDVDVLDDGYKWRKYGQKVVKNSLHPRSYYRCTHSNCRVKKRVERLSEDCSMVITTYEGRHTHSPSQDSSSVENDCFHSF